MSTQIVSQKRKSADGATAASKKVKMAKSAEKPAPLKSSLKKPRLETSDRVEVTKPSSKEKAVAKTGKKKISNRETTEQTEETFVDDEENGATELAADQTAALLAGFSSSEDEADSDDESGVAISSLPKAPTTGAIQKRIKQAISNQEDPETTPGVIYIGRIPHGFFEPQMKAYFSQFGDILNLRLARNKKTGASRHYAFVEFASAAVADIVAKTMDKYLLFGHILQVRRVPREQITEGLFKGTGRKRKPAPMNRFEGRKLRQGATREIWERRVEMENQRRAEKADRLRDMGYDFDMPLVKGVSEVPPRAKDVEEIAVGENVGGVVGLLQSEKPASMDVLETVQNVQQMPEKEAVVEETITKKRSASGRTQTKKTVKRVKT